MTRFAVDPAHLSAIARSIREAAAEVEAVTSDSSLRVPTSALVDPVLIGAMSDFTRRWSHGLGTLIDDAHRLADGLDLVAAYYEDTDICVRTAVGHSTAAPGSAP